MDYPRLRIRPKSTETTTVFRGLERRPGAGIGKWHDERNLSADRCPRMCVRPARIPANDVDNDPLQLPIAAICGGEHMVLLDTHGNLHCNGYEVALPMLTDTAYHWAFTLPQTEGAAFVKPASGRAGAKDALGKYNGQSILTEHDRTMTMVWDSGDEEWRANGAGTDHMEELRELGGVQYHVWTFDENVIEIWMEEYPADGYAIELSTWSDSEITDDDRQMVRMGAYVIIWPDKLFVNAVKLASGAEMEAGTDYGELTGSANGFLATLTLCDIDGNPYNGVVVQDYQPVYQEGYWLDTSQDAPVLREWNYLSAAWISVASTFVRVSSLAYGDPNMASIKAHDTVQILWEGEPGVDEEARKLLQGAHYLYNLIDNGDDSYDIVIAGILSSDSITAVSTQIDIHKRIPDLDFVVEAGNRLWGCRYSEADAINEIYASKLGDATNWEVFQGLSTDSWTASRGTAAPFTGAAVLDGHPLFFREESMEKVFPSSVGAHQIATYTLEGVEQGAANSLCVIEDRLYYKSRQGIMVYAGTVPRRISDALGDMAFRGGSAARHQRKYCLSTTMESTGETVVLVYDLETGDWHIETEGWTGRAVTWRDNLYYVQNGQIYRFGGSEGSGNVDWYAETDDLSINLPEHKWISYLRLRFKLETDAVCRVMVSYDAGNWQPKGTLHGTLLHTQELGIWPRRCDHFRLRLEGSGGCEMQSISYRMERSEGGH